MERSGCTGTRNSKRLAIVAHTLLGTIFPKPLAEIEPDFLKKGHWEGELEHTLQDGTRIVVSSRWVLQRDENGVPIQVMESNNDITERKQAEESSRKAKVEAEFANRAKSDFLANMSHEIRTPVNAITGMVHLALRANPDTKQRTYLTKIDTAAQNLLGIMNDILDVSKIEAGKVTLERIAFSLDEVLRNVRDIVSGKADTEELRLVFSLWSRKLRAIWLVIRCGWVRCSSTWLTMRSNSPIVARSWSKSWSRMQARRKRPDSRELGG